MADQRTMAELLRVPTEGYAEGIVVPPILTKYFELKHSLINMMTSDQFFGLEKDNPHDHIPRRWLEKEPSRSILTWEDLVSKFINEFFPPSRMTNLQNEISTFQQRFDESFHEAWDRYKDLLRACPHHGFTELHQLDTFYNALNPTDQDSLNSAAGGNLLERSTRDVLTIIENKSKVRNSRNKSIVSQVKSSDVNSSSSSEIAKLTHAVNQQTSAVTTAMTAILKQFQATPPPASVKAVEEICVTCGGAHPYYQCLAADGNTFPEYRDNIQGYVSAAAVNYNQGNSGYRPPSVANQIRPPGFAQPNVQNNQNRFSQPQGYNRGNNFNQNTSYQAPTQQNQVVPLSELEKIKKINDVNIKAMQAQINNAQPYSNEHASNLSGSGSLPSNTVANSRGELKAITTRSGLVLDGPSVPMPPPFINPEEDERVEETLTDPDLAEFTINVPPPLVQKAKPTSLKNYVVYQRDPLHPNIPYPSRMNQEKRQEKDEAAILRIIEKLRDPGKFLIPCGFSELKCKALADLGANINLMPLSLESLHSLPISSSLIMKAILVPSSRITNNVSHKDYLEDLFANEKITNHQSGNPTFSSHTDLTSPEVINPLSGNPTLISEPVTKSSSSLTMTSFEESDLIWEEFESYLARNDDMTPEDVIRGIEYFLNHDPLPGYSPNNDLVDTIHEMFTDEHTLDYSSPPLYDDVDDNLVELESDNDNVYDDPFDSKVDKIKESKLLIDELDPPKSSDFLPSPKCDSVLYEDFSEVDALPSTNNEDKVFNSGILIHENLFEVTIRVTPDKNVKKLSSSNASLILEDFNPPLYELPFHKEVPGSETLLSFSSENEEKVFNPGILTSKGVHTSLIPELSHRSPKAFKVIKIFESPMEIFPCSYGEDIHVLDVMIAPDFEASRSHGFVLRSLELQILSFIMGIQYPNLID
ncbi:reverse transcriptase domain-containing protein [Tanacetum coccineum]